MAEAATATLDIRASDLSRTRKFKLSGVPIQASVGELVRGALGRMGLASVDRDGREISYRARHERSGRQLHPSERIGDVLRTDDEIVLTPRVNAG